MVQAEKIPLGRQLIRKGVISEDQLRIALIEQRWSWRGRPQPESPASIDVVDENGNSVPAASVTWGSSNPARATVSATKAINVTQVVNVEPVALVSASPGSVNEGGAVSLIGSASYDPDNDPITYAWSQVGGPAVTITNANAATAGFTAPSVSSTTMSGRRSSRSVHHSACSPPSPPGS